MVKITKGGITIAREVISVKEVAKYLGITPDTVYRMARRGEIPAVRVGRCWRFPKVFIEQWLKEKVKIPKVWKYERKKAKEVGKVQFGSYKLGIIEEITRREIYKSRIDRLLRKGK